MNLLSGKHYVVLALATVLHTNICLGQEIETLNKYRRLKLAADYYETGISAFEKNEFQSAEESLEKSIQLDPNNHMAYYFLGSCNEQLGYSEQALLNYTLAISLKHEFSEALFSRAALYFKLKRYKESIEDFYLLLELPPEETQAVYFRGIKYGENDAQTGFDEIISMSRNEADIYQYLGQNYRELEKYDTAILHYSTAIQLQPENDNYYVNRGINYAENGEKDSARSDYLMALKINPDNSMAKLNLAFLSEDEIGFSLDNLNDFIARNPHLAIGYVNRAYYHYKKSSYQDAIYDYDSAILLDPENQEYYTDRGMSYEKLEKYKLALNDYETATTLDPDNSRAWYLMGNVFFKLEELDSSIDHYSRSLSLDPSSGNTYYNRGLAYFYSDELEKACSDMKKAYSLSVKKAEIFLSHNCQ